MFVAPDPVAAVALPSVWDLVKSGGPLMWPLGLCSVVALAYTVERWIALRDARLGDARLARAVLSAAKDGGVQRAAAITASKQSALARILDRAFALSNAGPEEREREVEDFATGEVKRLSWNLKPLLLVYLVAPLLGLLGTVWGLIECFASIATQQGLGRPDVLASGVYQALVTTAAGLTIAIPTLVAYTYLKSRIERFARVAEELYGEVERALASRNVALPAVATATSSNTQTSVSTSEVIHAHS